MSGEELTRKFKELSAKYVKAIQLDKLDRHDSLTFLHRNYKVHPSELITLMSVFVVLVVLLLDGCNLIASVVCFLLPLVQCLVKMGREESKQVANFMQSNVSDQNSRLTDE